jgi:hypothetical protein
MSLHPRAEVWALPCGRNWPGPHRIPLDCAPVPLHPPPDPNAVLLPLDKDWKMSPAPNRATMPEESAE